MSSIFEPISDDAYKQIEVRQTKISGSFRDNETIAWLNSNGAFVRLKSSIDIIDEELRKNIGEFDDQPFQLASRYTLQGGIKGGFTYNPLTAIRETGELKGLSFFSDFKDLASKAGILGSEPVPAYGFEGTSITGLKPIPGIEKVSIKTVGEGYLREATINLRANSPEQLNILDALYFRPGYSVLLEWGHASYFTNEGVFEGNPYNEIVLADKTKSEILNEIEKNRKESSYNYDAMFAVIENFQWNFRDDGGYDVTLKLISTGDVVDSLKINGVSAPAPTQDNNNSDEKDVLPYIKEYNKSIFHKNLIPLLYSGTGAIPKIKVGFFESPVNVIPPQDKISNTKWWNWIIGGEQVVFKQFDLTQYKKFIDLNFSQGIIDNPKYNKIFFVAKIGEQIQSIDTSAAEKEKTNLDYNCYIKLYTILDLLNNLYSINNYQKISIDNPISMFYPGYSVSVDPNTCITLPGRQWKEDRILTGGIFKKLYNEDNSFILSNNTADLREIYIEINKVLSIFDNNIDKEGNLTLKTFLDTLLQEINSSTGYSNNNFKVIQNNDENLEIVSLFNNPDIDTFETLKQRKLENFGNKTIFKSISLSSELTDNISSQVAISAQVGDTDVNGEKGDVFAYFNNGIVDRIIPKKETEYSKNNKDNKRENLQTQYDSLANYIYTIYPVYLENGIATPLITASTAKKYLKEILTYVLQNDPKTKGASILIPVNLSFTMQGFSGFKLFNEFIIPTDFLPNLYKSSNGVDPKFKFVVKGINHDISTNKWDTSIETFMGPFPSQSPFSGSGDFIPFQQKFDFLTEALEENRATVYAADATRTNNLPQQDRDIIQQTLQNQANQDNTPFDSGVTPVENP